MRSTIISVNALNTYEEGDVVTISIIENRWYVKFWYFITFRTLPTRVQKFVIAKTECETNTITTF